MGGDVGRGRRPDRQAVAGDPGRHRREEDVGERSSRRRARGRRRAPPGPSPRAPRCRARSAGRPRPARSRRSTGAGSSGRRRAGRRSPNASPPRGPRARPRAAGSAGQRPALGVALGQRLGDRERVPEQRSRPAPSTRSAGTVRAPPKPASTARERRACRAGRSRTVTGRPKRANMQPAAERPARIAAVADREDVGHRVPPRLPGSHAAGAVVKSGGGRGGDKRPAGARNRDRSAVARTLAQKSFRWRRLQARRRAGAAPSREARFRPRRGTVSVIQSLIVGVAP